MKPAFLLLLVGLTSAAAYLAGVRAFGLAGRWLGPALSRVLECAGLTLVFFGANVALGIGAILAARALTGAFVSLYLAHDLVLLVLSLLQALVFTWWRAQVPRQGGSGVPRRGSAIDHT